MTASTQDFAVAFKPLRIASQGMCCALGFDTAAAVAAIRARLNHFQQTQFVSTDGQPLTGAQLYGVDLWGAARHASMLRTALDDCLARATRAGFSALPHETALWLLTPEPTRATYPAVAMAAIVSQLVDERGLHPHSGCAPLGKGAVATAFLRLGQLMDDPAPASPIRRVLLASTDSLLDAACIEHLIEQDRLAYDGHTDALIPGEGAAALLLTREPADHSAQPSVWVTATSQAQDAWRLGSDTPLRAVALTDAMRQASKAAGCKVSDMEFQVSGATGEDWCVKEASMALSRAMERRRDVFAHHMPSQYLGETGAAAPLLTLAWLSEAMSRPKNRLGTQGLAHFAGDDGQRSVLVVQRRP